MCVCDILLIEPVSPSPAWRVLCPPLHQVCLNEMGWQSEEKLLGAASPKGYSSKVWSPAPSPSQGGTWQARDVRATTSICQAKPFVVLQHLTCRSLLHTFLCRDRCLTPVGPFQLRAVCDSVVLLHPVELDKAALTLKQILRLRAARSGNSGSSLLQCFCL